MKLFNAEKLVTIIIPSKIFDSNLKFCITKIRKYYKNINIILLLDKVIKIKKIKKTKIIQTGNKTIGFKRNLGVKLSNTPFVSFIDSDAYPNNRWLDFILSSFKKNKNVKVVGGPNVSPKTKDIERKLVAKVRKFFFVTFDNRVKFIRDTDHFVKFLPSVNFVIKKNIYLKLGGMNEIVNTGEDGIFMNDLNKKNYKMLLNGRAYVFHKDRNFKNYLRQRIVYGSNIFKNFFLSPSFSTFFMCLSILPFLYLLLFPLAILSNYLILKLYLSILVLMSLFILYCSLKIYEKNTFFKSFKVVFISIFGPGLGFAISLIKSDKYLRKIYTQE